MNNQGSQGLPNRIVVIGTSTGGVPALQKLVSELPADFPAAVLVVLHIGTHASRLPSILARQGPLQAVHAQDGEAIQPGRIYVAPPDVHMLVEGPVVRLFRGPKEHHTRPAIDPLFRSAALSCGANVIGVVLTGMLDDGTAGLQAIKQYGGVAIVQDPNDASAPEMPLSALKHVNVDHCLPLAAIPQALIRLTASASDDHFKPVDGGRFVSNEQTVFLGEGDAMQELKACAAPSTFVCPDCNGSLWKILAADPPRYRCHTGHAFTLRTLENAQSEATDSALWGALRAIQEKRMVLLELASACRRENDEARAVVLDRQCSELEEQGRALRAWLETAKALDSNSRLVSDDIS